MWLAYCIYLFSFFLSFFKVFLSHTSFELMKLRFSINQSQALKRWPASCNRPCEPAPFSVNRIWPLACPALRFLSLFSSLVPLLYLNLDQRAHVNQLTGALISGPWSASLYFFSLFVNIYICEIDYTWLSGCVTKAPRWTSPMDRQGSCKVMVTELYCTALWLRFESI